MTTIVPNQFFGLGDIIFTQTLVRHIADGRDIAWPVFPQFVEGLRRAYPDILWLDYKAVNINYERRDQYEMELPNWGTCTVLPLRFADQLLKVPYTQCMRAKYDLYSLDWQMWKDRGAWCRDGLRELELSRSVGKVDRLVNRTFGSDGQFTADIPGATNDAHMRPTDKYSLFDWAHIMRNVAAIHTVSTSIIYLLEMLELKAPEVHLYPRKPLEQDFRNVDYLLQKHKYVLHV